MAKIKDIVVVKCNATGEKNVFNMSGFDVYSIVVV